MNFSNSPKQGEPSSSLSKPPHLILRQAVSNLHSHCSTFFHHHQNNTHFFFSNILHPSSFKTHFDSALSNLQNNAKQAIEAGFSNFRNNPFVSVKNSPPWARIAEQSSNYNAVGGGIGVAMTSEAIEERLAGVPVYALSNASQEFVLVSGESTGKSLGLFCFKEQDAEALLQQMRSMDPAMRDGSQVVAVALNKVIQLKLDGVAFRLIPEMSQIKNALKERRKAGIEKESFPGVPVFQARSLILRSQGKRYHPVFFRKEDLEKSLLRASGHQNRLNPVFREGDIQVAVLENIIEAMKDNATSTWDDVVFIPPGFDVSTDPSQK